MSARPHRVLVVDDNPRIHDDFRKILAAPTEAAVGEIEDLEQALFGGGGERATGPCYALDSAHQGQEALACVERAQAVGRPYALAFVDVRMPPGWDSIETIERLWAADPALQAVICTASSDCSWDETVARLGWTDRLLILKKPFDTIEVRQMAVALTTKWALARQVEEQIAGLEEAARRAAELAELRARFVAMLSHEFRTPLAAIMTTSDALARYADRMTADDRVERQARIHREIHHLTRLLDNGQALSRDGLDRFPCNPQPVDLLALCRESIAQCQATLGAATRLVFEVDRGDTSPALDPTLVRQILDNLLSNAVKYSPEGGTISLQVEGGADRVRLRVRDQGIGMSEADQALLFEPYHRGANVGAIGGLGLGLTITHKAVQAHHGTITVASAVGEGTTFEVTLPDTATAMAPTASSGREQGRA